MKKIYFRSNNNPNDPGKGNFKIAVLTNERYRKSHRIVKRFTIADSQNSFGLKVGRFSVSVKQWPDHCPWLVLQYRRQKLLWNILVRLAGLQCIVGIKMELGHCLGVRHKIILGCGNVIIEIIVSNRKCLSKLSQIPNWVSVQIRVKYA
jgi:hypothetical protein